MIDHDTAKRSGARLRDGALPRGRRLGPYAALLFDMDGTILTSIAAVERSWTAWARRVGHAPREVVTFIHGRTAADTIRAFLPPAADVAAELAWLDARERQDLAGIAEVPGAGAFLASLPEERWAIVTSANRQLALARIAAAGLPLPRVLVTADDVARGKPDPAGYCRAAELLGVKAEACLVFEDAMAGVEAGAAAGADVVWVGGAPPARAAQGILAIRSYEGMTAHVGDGAISLSFAAPATSPHQAGA